MRALAVLLALAIAPAARADEGMWPFNLVPVDAVKKTHGVTLAPALLEQAMKASVRFNNGGSGSFVSQDGLVMTNHHVAETCIAQLSDAPGADNHMQDGFVASSRADERRCPDLELNALQKIADVTAQVEAAASDARFPASVPRPIPDGDKNTARKSEMSKIEKACVDAGASRCDVVTLYGGGMYHLYTYQKYTDVRLVFAPEFQIAFFGGDADNFTFPRNDLDVAFFRVYQAGAPAHVSQFLPFSPRGPKEGEVVFVSGHPGSTDRFTVLAKLELLRDVTYPKLLERNRVRRDLLVKYQSQGDLQQRAAHDDVFSVENGLKAVQGYQSGLTDNALMGDFKKRQDQLLAKLNALPDGAERERLLAAWPKLEQAYRGYRGYALQLLALDRQLAPGGALVSIAKHLVRLADELPKKSEDRLREYRDSNLASLELQLLSTAPIEPGLEIEEVAFGLTNMQLLLGKKDPSTRAALASMEPRARAEQVIKGTKLADVAVRKAVYARISKGTGRAALDELKDPLVDMIRSYDKAARDLRKKYEDEVEGVERTYNGRIAEAMGKVYGTSIYPDATFTLRLAVGTVKGYVHDGKPVPWATRFGDLYAKSKRNKNAGAYALPTRWSDNMKSTDFTVPFNFVSTHDITGGNSGSPMWNQHGEVVGLIFDGNIHSLPNRFVYAETKARAVSVASNGILHALDRVYGARHVVAELTAPLRPSDGAQ